ncbi:uncharacterized protein [Globicephala melas]|uniref:uncharacterized protein isoform X2 n=1 Tax=Globicephala melas TaxID=9731 RepID=UPI003873341D
MWLVLATMCLAHSPFSRRIGTSTRSARSAAPRAIWHFLDLFHPDTRNKQLHRPGVQEIRSNLQNKFAFCSLTLSTKRTLIYYLCLFQFLQKKRKGKNAAETQKKIYAVYGEGAMTEQWFVKFRAGDFLLNDAPLSGRPGFPWWRSG